MYIRLGFMYLRHIWCPASAFKTAERDEARNPQRLIHVTVWCKLKKERLTK